MIVILNRDVKGTGKAGDIVKVSDGYARNMLLPKGYATEATQGNIRSLEKQKELMAQKKAEEKARLRNWREAGRSQSRHQDQVRRRRPPVRLHHVQGHRGSGQRADRP